MIDKYDYFNNLQIADFYYILYKLNDCGAITITSKNKLYKKLNSILKDYKEN